jgi:anti-sigma factor ChrR (cupin superfamily)
MDLDAIRFEPTRHAGISIHFYHNDPDTGHAAVMIQMEPGTGYPGHRHVGVEELIVLRGGFRDGDGEWRAGDYARFEPGSWHAPVALEDGPACVFFAVAHRGIEIEPE